MEGTQAHIVPSAPPGTPRLQLNLSPSNYMATIFNFHSVDYFSLELAILKWTP